MLTGKAMIQIIGIFTDEMEIKGIKITPSVIEFTFWLCRKFPDIDMTEDDVKTMYYEIVKMMARV